jgi:hypothetical protein
MRIATLSHAKQMSDLEFSEHPMLSVEIPDREAKLTHSEDRSLLDVAIQNSLPCVCTPHSCYEVSAG